MFTATVMGYVGRDLEMIGKIGKFSIKFQQGSGEYRKWCFVDCKVIGGGIARIQEQFPKGSPIIANGRMEVEEWDDKTSGQKRSKMVFIVSDSHFVVRASEDRPAEPPAPTGDSW